MMKYFFDSIRTLIRKNKLLFSLLLSYGFVCIFLVCVLSVSLFRTFAKQNTQDYITASSELMNRTADTVDLLFSDLYETTSFYFENDALLQRAMYDREFSSGDLVAIRERLTEYLSQNPYLHSVYIVNVHTGTVFSSFPGRFSFTDFYDASVLDHFLLPSGADEIYSRSASSTVYGISLPSNLISIVHKKLSHSGRVDGGIITNISCSYLQEMLSSDSPMQGNMYIIDDNGKILFHSSDADTMLKLPDDLHAALVSAKNKTSFSYRKDGTDYTVLSRPGSSFDFTYFTMVSTASIQAGFRQLRIFILLFSVLLLSTAILIAFAFAMRIYTPFYQFTSKIRSKINRQLPEMPADYNYLNATYEYLLGNIENLSREMEHYCLNRLLSHKYESYETLQNDLKRWDLSFSFEYFLVVRFTFCHFKKLRSSYDPAKLQHFQKDIASAITQNFFLFAEIKTVLPKPDSIALILNAASFSPKDISCIQAAAAEAIYAIYQKFEIELCAGISEPAPSLLTLYTADSQASFAASCHVLRTAANLPFKACILAYNEVKYLEQAEVCYPQIFEKALLSSIKSMHIEEISENLDHFFSSLTHTAPELASLYLTRLCVPLSSFFSETKDTSLPHDFSSLKTALEFSDTLYEKQLYLNQLLQHYLIQKQSWKKQLEEQIVHQIQEWITEHFSDASLTLETIASANHYSSSYLRRIFKDVKHTSPTDFLMNLRIEKAKELLLDTTLPAVQICEKIGISNPKYFYSIFKKTTGYTTSEFRKKRGKPT